MNTTERYQSAKDLYKNLGVETDRAMEMLKNISISMHCWQGDDVTGFDDNGPLSGGIQTTGNYHGRARTPWELMDDIDKALEFVAGTHKLNLHACYAVFEKGKRVDRDKLEAKHFAPWVEFANQRGMGIDFNPTMFSHPKAAGLTLSSPEESIRKFWINHCIACIRISEHFAEATGQPCVMNIWIPDGLKDVPGNRIAPRARFKDSLDRILAAGYDRNKVKLCLESKVFGIGMESYTVGSSEFALGYAAKNNILPLLDNGHYHPTEVVSDKLSAVLLFFDEVALHITRPIRWDSDHVVLFDDETKELAKEIIRCDALNRVKLGLDFFDASINRVAAWVIGMRNLQKALLYALLEPSGKFSELQDQKRFTELILLQEELKTYPFGDVWRMFCTQNGVPQDESWFEQVREYENQVQLMRRQAKERNQI